MTRRAAALVVLTLWAITACGADTDTATTDTADGTDQTTGAAPATTARPGTATDPAPATPTAGVSVTGPVGELTLELEDTSRATPAGASTPASPTRALPTRVWYPTETTDPVPLIVFAHGLDGHPDVFTGLFGAWAAAGYVVAAPVFPLTNNTVPDAWSNFSGVADQPADLSFVTDQVLEAAADPASPLSGRVVTERIGVGGLSLGGATTYLAGLNQATRDPRFDAAMVLDGVAGNDAATGTFLEPSGVPAFLAHCARDPLADVSIAERAYALLAPPKYLVVMDGVCHSEAFEDAAHPLDAIATEITIAFWDTWLAGTTDEDTLAATLDRDPALTWQHELP